MMVETILESSQDFGMSNGVLPQWKRELLQRRQARGRAPCAAAPAPPPPPPPPPPPDEDEELRYGPGIVKRLKSRYLSLALRDAPRRRASVLRRAASLEHLLDERPPPAPRAARAPRPASLAPAPPHQSVCVKRARSVDALSRLDAAPEPEPRPPRPPRRPQPLLREAERPPPDVVRAALRKFESAPPRRAAPAARLSAVLRGLEPRRSPTPDPAEPPATAPPPAPTSPEPMSPVSDSPAPIVDARSPSPTDRPVSPPRSPVRLTSPPPSPSPPTVSVAKPSPRMSPTLVAPSPRMSPTLVVPSPRMSPTLVAPSLRMSPTLVVPSPRMSPTLVAPSLRMSPTLVAPSPRTSPQLVAHSAKQSPPIVPTLKSDTPAAPTPKSESKTSPSAIVPPSPKVARSPSPPQPPAESADEWEGVGPGAAAARPVPRAALEEIARAGSVTRYGFSAARAAPHLPPLGAANSVLLARRVGVIRPMPAAPASPEPAAPPRVNGHSTPEPGALSRIGAAGIERAWSGSAVKRIEPPPAEERPAWRRAGPARARPPPPAATSVVFNFSNRKEVPDYIENDGIILRASRRNRIKAGEPGVVVLRPAAPESESSGEEAPDGGPPSPCDVRFVNDNVLINGKSSMPARPDKDRIAKLKLQFDDSLTRTFEYPSETSLCEDAPADPAPPAPAPPAPDAPAPLADNTHIASAALARYTPSKTCAAAFQLGLANPRRDAAPESAGEGEGAGDGAGADAGAAADEARGAAPSWSDARAHRTDLLF